MPQSFGEQMAVKKSVMKPAMKAGSKSAIIAGYIPVGHHVVNRYQPKKDEPKTEIKELIRIYFELPTETETITNGQGEEVEKRRIIGRFYNYVWNDSKTIHKNTLKELFIAVATEEEIENERINGDTDLPNFFINRQVSLNVRKDEDKNDPTVSYNSIDGAFSCQDDAPKYILQGVPLVFNTDFEVCSGKEFESLPEFLQKKIQESEEWKKSHHQDGFRTEGEPKLEDLPF